MLLGLTACNKEPEHIYDDHSADLADEAAVKAVYDSIDDAVETINVSFVMTKAAR